MAGRILPAGCRVPRARDLRGRACPFDAITASYGAGAASSPIRWHAGHVYWDSPVYRHEGLAGVSVIDPDMNLDPDTVDSVVVGTWSDANQNYVWVDTRETGPDTGEFEGVLILDLWREAGHRLFVRDGDTLYARYVDYTPPSGARGGAERVATSAVALAADGPGRVLVSAARAAPALQGAQPLEAGRLLSVSFEVASNLGHAREFTALVRIADPAGTVHAILSWAGTMGADPVTVGVDWRPLAPDRYTATLFVLGPGDPQVPLARPTTLPFTVS